MCRWHRLQQSYMISPKKSFLGGETGGCMVVELWQPVWDWFQYSVEENGAFMRSMQSASSSSSPLPLSLSLAPSLSLSPLLWELTTEEGGAFLLYKPCGPFSSDSAKLFAFVSPSHSHVFSHHVRFMAGWSWTWTVNLQRLRGLWSWREQAGSQRDRISSLSSPERWREREREEK